MRNILLLAVVATSAMAQPAYAWDYATNTGSAVAGGGYTKCFYTTIFGYKFSTVTKGMCPYTVQVDPPSGQVKQ